MATHMTEVERLAQDIASKTQKYVTILRENGAALPSHDAATPRNDTLPLAVTALQDELMELTTALQALIQGPRLYVQNQILAHVDMVILHAIYRFQLPSRVPIDGNISYEQLAKEIGVDESIMRRIFRYAITNHLFCEIGGTHLVHSATSRMLAESPMMMRWIGMVCEEMWPAAMKVVPGLMKWPGSKEPQHSGYALANNLDTHLFGSLANEPERAARFADAMLYFNSAQDFAPHHLCDAFDWAQVGKLVEVGGSTGNTAVILASRFPKLQIVIQDYAVLEEQARRSISKLTDCVTFMVHDIFQEQPVCADVYHFRWIFHNWPDKYCTMLLRAQIPALKAGARIVIQDFVVPESGTAPFYQEKLSRGFDLAMMELFNSKEREQRDWIKMFGDADSRFRFDGVRTVPGANLSFITAIWNP